jgi:hypothetical protein
MECNDSCIFCEGLGCTKVNPPSFDSSDIELSVNCINCEESSVFKVGESDFTAWKSGKKIDLAFPYLTVEERETVCSLVCGTCFDTMCADLPED